MQPSLSDAFLVARDGFSTEITALTTAAQSLIDAIAAAQAAGAIVENASARFKDMVTDLIEEVASEMR